MTMINHARTLLLNQTADGINTDETGYEYVPAEYRAIRLPTTLQTIYSIIFGKNPDSYFRNYRVRELLSYLHQTELADYMYQLDPRVTYWPAMIDNKLYGTPKKVFIQQRAGEPTRLGIGGTVNAAAAIGRSDYEYNIFFGYRTGIEPEPTFIVQSATNLNKINTTTFAGSNFLRAVPLFESDLKVRIGELTTAGRLTTELADILVIESYSEILGGEILLEEVNELEDAAGDTAQLSNVFAANLPLVTAINQLNLTRIQNVWTVSARANPAPAITSVLPNLEFLGEPTYLELFGVAPEEPYKTFQNLWEDHPLPAYRLSGMVLAFIYRMNELLRI